MKHNLAVLLLAGAVLFPGVSMSAPEAPGKERTESFIAGLKRVKSDDGNLGDADKAANAKLFRELDAFLDFDALTTQPIAPRASKLTADELVTFKKKFKELIRLIAYPNAGRFFGKAKLTFLPEEQLGDRTLVPLKVMLPEEDLETEVRFRWARVGGTLKIEDVLFEGDSLVKDYQNQLAKIVDKSGAPGLMKALDDRLAELAKGNKARK